MFITAFALAAVAAQQGAPMPDYKQARRAIAEADAQLFWAGFEGCDPAAMEPLLLPEFSMVHDQGGLVADSRAAFIANLAEQCAARAPGGKNAGYANRRLPVPGTRIVRPLGQWGMLEEGAHTFFERDDEGAWQLTGGARYMHVWQWMPDEERFRLKSSISYDHGAAAPYPPSPL